MPNWKKLITSGSDATLNSLNVTTTVQAVSFTGSLFGQATQALTASYLLGNVEVYGYYFSQSIPDTTWTITHDLNTQTPLVQVYDSSYKTIIPNEITNTSLTTTVISFTYNQAGFAVVSRGDGIPQVLTSSYAIQAATASYLEGSVSNAISSSYAVTASYLEGSVSNAISSSYALTASYVQTAQTASYFITSSVSTASYVELAQTASYVLNAKTASYVLNAQTASYVLNAQTASYVVNALTASYFITSSVSTASYVQTAQTASYVLNAVSSSYALSASYAPNTTFPYTGSGIISGSLSITGSNSISGSLAIAGLRDFADDTAAAAGGIPINGIYRNGNFLLIRLS